MDESMSPRRPSAVPDDCIIRCIDRSVCFNTAARATGNSSAILDMLVRFKLRLADPLTIRTKQPASLVLFTMFFDIQVDLVL
jgi:hypothetical protein